MSILDDQAAAMAQDLAINAICVDYADDEVDRYLMSILDEQAAAMAEDLAKMTPVVPKISATDMNYPMNPPSVLPMPVLPMPTERPPNESKFFTDEGLEDGSQATEDEEFGKLCNLYSRSDLNLYQDESQPPPPAATHDVVGSPPPAARHDVAGSPPSGPPPPSWHVVAGSPPSAPPPAARHDAQTVKDKNERAMKRAKKD
jgi:hypothetical protein